MIGEHDIDRPEVRAEVEAAFAEYEQALVGNDVATLDRLFLDRETTIRYGAGENLYGLTGALLAVPVANVVQTIYLFALRRSTALRGDRTAEVSAVASVDDEWKAE